MQKTLTRTGVVAELNGKYWGIQYQDSHATSYGWGEIEKATVSNSAFCNNPTDMTYKNSPHFTELSKARLVEIEIETIYKTK